MTPDAWVGLALILVTWLAAGVMVARDLRQQTASDVVRPAPTAAAAETRDDTAAARYRETLDLVRRLVNELESSTDALRGELSHGGVR